MKYIIAVFITLFLFGCNNTENQVDNKDLKLKTSKLSGSILEKLDVNKYTYVKIKNSKNQEVWLAGPKDDVKVGDKVSVASGMLMKDFVSKSLNRTFKEIYFVGSLTGKASAKKGGFHGGMKSGSFHGNSKGSFHGGSKKMENPHKTNNKAPLGKEFDVKKIEKVEGGYSIEEIFQKKNELNGKVIKVKGMVVKFTPEIMKRNWVHIKDGSGKTEGNDLTITTTETVKVGDTITFEGTLAVDKDFGYGYKYSVIVEKSTVK